MKTIYSSILLLFMVPALVCAHPKTELKGKYTKEKSLKKEFEVNSDALMKISNTYGNLDITSWNENRIVMEIKIKVSGNDEEKVINKLKSIDVDFSASPEMVSAKTIFNKENDSWWGKWTSGWNNNVNMKINYIVKVPVSNKVDLDNNYGSITLDKIEGTAHINCDYGQIILGELLGDNNYINIDYTDNSTIEYMKNGKINADYSGFEVMSAEQIDLNADYTQSKFNTVKELNYNCDYGGIRINSADMINGNGDYLKTKIGEVGKSITVSSDYGSIGIKELKSSAKAVTIKTSYSGVSIGFDNEAKFNFLIKTSYGGVKLDESIQIEKSQKHSNRKEYEGFYGSANSGNNITISSSYGSVKLINNQ